MKTEKVVGIFLILGLALKFFHIPGGNVFTILPMTLLALLYFPFGFYFLSYKKIENKTIGFSIASGFALAMLIIGCEFKIMHWPGAMITFITGFITCLPIAVISNLNYTKPKSEETILFYKNIFIRVLIAIIFGLLSLVF